MIQALKVSAAVGLLAATATIASAAPAGVGQIADGVSNGVVQVHGNHRSCQRDRGGWHRHNEWGERRRCRAWRGQGRRPDACVKFGPIWYCDY
jgi:hypothetical protein